MEKSFETHDWRHELPKDNELHAFLTIKLWKDKRAQAFVVSK